MTPGLPTEEMGGSDMESKMSNFVEQVSVLADRSKAAERQALTEEATKTAVVLPFIQTLGFDVFNLDEVIPEFDADVGVKKGEKVDFAIKVDGRVSILVEVKSVSVKLGASQFNQLFRYFTATEARLAVLTNGREAWFFSDTDAPNKMDKKPFFKFDFQKYDSDQIEDLARFRKRDFAIDSIIEAASNLKYTRKAAIYLKQQLSEPNDDFVKLVGRNIHDGAVTKSVVEQVRPAIQSALDDLIRDRIQEKLSITLRGEDAPKDGPEPTEKPKSDIVTTDEEKEGFRIIQAIGAKYIPVDRITIRDAKSYCAVLLDDNNRKPICRLYFNSETTKNIGLFDAGKAETKIRVDGPSDLYKHIDAITETIKALA